MKKYIYTLLFAASIVLGACSEDKLDSHSIFDTESPERNAFDTWLLLNYVVPYNIQFNYKYIDKESDNTYNLIPAEYDKCVAMAKLTKYLWIDSYNELLGETFIKTYCPRMIQLIGSKAYNSQGSVVLGTAEGGLKITLYNVNELNANSPDIDFLNTWFFKTMHHEFAHILHQTKNYSTDFNLISTDYQGPSWLNLESDEVANTMGFITRYASFSPDEDFVEIISNYITHDAGYWENVLNNGGALGKIKLQKKFDIVRKYLKDSWSIDIDKLRDIVQRRSGSLSEVDLENL
ncbi:putative zinc-binding metallopeptidase [Bacteroides intestinalis]|jgi:substrate import-associated zinc metallohydrolase lipoprotein|uniref:Substrate import-associated zinc metallohydrolase lipoprotein n=3 Tax=Bacteroides intestinalis TaxID=329854 RepID=A0A6N2WNR0_9BACE|nr:MULTISPECIES: putative zinc-binding metallopeptidase [Bacteroides]MBS6239881.1 putative zinc-binding metallopeptidase [Bacteroides sp.]